MGVIMYILLRGSAPFYSINDGNWSASMERKIKAGEYQFDGDDWQNFSEEAKLTIKRMLTVDPTQRITIGEILSCLWLTEPASERPIDVSSLRDVENWNQIQVSYET
jgi:serine/threonine protein kinase